MYDDEKKIRGNEWMDGCFLDQRARKGREGKVRCDGK